MTTGIERPVEAYEDDGGLVIQAVGSGEAGVKCELPAYLPVWA